MEGKCHVKYVNSRHLIKDVDEPGAGASELKSYCRNVWKDKIIERTTHTLLGWLGARVHGFRCVSNPAVCLAVTPKLPSFAKHFPIMKPDEWIIVMVPVSHASAHSSNRWCEWKHTALHTHNRGKPLNGLTNDLFKVLVCKRALRYMMVRNRMGYVWW